MLPAHLIRLFAAAALLASGIASADQYADEKLLPPSVKQLMEMKERTFSGDPNKASLRNEVFDYLGIKPTDGSLYIFVSMSMPKELIQSYVAEALWAGGVLVVRGIPDGMKLNDWIRQYAVPIVGRKGITAGITIDPILFDLYNVKSVPTMVWDETDRLIGKDCDTAKRMKPGEKGKPFPVNACGAYPESSYYSISGAVTIGYSLEKFTEAGAKMADKRLNAMRTYVPDSGKDAVEFSGDWDKYETPEMREELERAKKRGTRYESVIDSFTKPYFEEDYQRFGSSGMSPGLGGKQ